MRSSRRRRFRWLCRPAIRSASLSPTAAADKLRLLRQRSDDLHAIIPPGEDVRQASMAKIDAANALTRLISHPQEFGWGLSETDPLAVAAKKHLDKMTADAKRLTELQEVRSVARQAASQALAACGARQRRDPPQAARLPVLGEDAICQSTGTAQDRYRPALPRTAVAASGPLLLADRRAAASTRSLRATIDRINPARGYTKRNVKLVGRSANAAQHDMTPAEFRQFIITSYRWMKKAAL